MKKRIILCALTGMMALSVSGQSGTNSPYSQYGFGVLSDQSQGFNRGMNGVGLGLRKGNLVNTINPASYSAVDSLTMMFDVGLSGQITNFKEGGNSVNANNADFEYAVGLFRMRKNLGVSFGVLPYSNVGYSYSTTSKLQGQNVTMTESYSGKGGMHEVFVGAGWRVIKPLSVGFNVAFLWGNMNRSVAQTSSDTQIKNTTKTYQADISTYKLDFGLQWQQPITKTDMLTLGATLGLGHKLGADPICVTTTSDPSSGVSSSDTLYAYNGMQIPLTIGAGLGWNHSDKLFVGADFTMQKWGSVVFPVANGQQYTGQKGALKDSYKVSLGADYVPGATSRNFLKRVHYRVGAAYATPYYKVRGNDGPKELSVSAGFGIPLQNAYNNRSQLNISAQWVHASAKDMITENTFRINIGLTFNERWFSKWKID